MIRLRLHLLLGTGHWLGFGVVGRLGSGFTRIDENRMGQSAGHGNPFGALRDAMKDAAPQLRDRTRLRAMPSSLLPALLLAFTQFAAEDAQGLLLVSTEA